MQLASMDTDTYTKEASCILSNLRNRVMRLFCQIPSIDIALINLLKSCMAYIYTYNQRRLSCWEVSHDVNRYACVCCSGQCWNIWLEYTVIFGYSYRNIRICICIRICISIYSVYNIYTQHGAKFCQVLSSLPCIRARPYHCISWADSTPTRIYTTLLHYKIYTTLRIFPP